MHITLRVYDDETVLGEVQADLIAGPYDLWSFSASVPITVAGRMTHATCTVDDEPTRYLPLADPSAVLHKVPGDSVPIFIS